MSKGVDSIGGTFCMHAVKSVAQPLVQRSRRVLGGGGALQVLVVASEGVLADIEGGVEGDVVKLPVPCTCFLV